MSVGESISILSIGKEDEYQNIQPLLDSTGISSTHVSSIDEVSDDGFGKSDRNQCDLILLFHDKKNTKLNETLILTNKKLKDIPIIIITKDKKISDRFSLGDFSIIDILDNPESLVEKIKDFLSKNKEIKQWKTKFLTMQKEVDTAKSEILQLIFEKFPYVLNQEDKPTSLGIDFIVNKFITVVNDLENTAYYDPATELPNHNLFEIFVKKMVARSKRHDHKTGLVIIDIEDIESVGNMLGKYFSDQVLKEMAIRIAQSIRENDILSRISETQLAILIDEINTQEDLDTVSNKILKILHEPYNVFGNSVTLDSNIGISCYPDSAKDAYTLITNAQSALHHSKGKGRNKQQIYTNELYESHLRRVSLENALSMAIDQNEFYMVYQPQFGLKTGKVTGIEAFLRWENKEFKEVSPYEFIPAAERIGIISRLTHFVFEKSCEELSNLKKETKIKNLKLSINISSRQLLEINGLRIDIQKIFDQFNISVKNIELEITEPAFIEKSEDAESIINNLNEMGFRIAADNFGTGFTSLSNFIKMPLCTIKIDASFVQKLNDKFGNLAVKSIIALGNSLNIDVIASGIETEEQKNLLIEYGCAQGQGYYLCNPLKYDALVKKLKNLN